MQTPPPPATPPLRVIVITEQKLVADALEALLTSSEHFTVGGKYRSVQTALAARSSLGEREVAVIDLHLESGCRERHLRLLRTSHPHLPVVWLSDACNESDAVALARARLRHLVHKTDSADHLLLALHAASSGRPYHSPTAHKLLIDIKSLPPPTPKILSPREQAILALIAGGLGNAEIAARLGLAPSTAQTHRRNIMGKLGLRSTSALQAYAQQSGAGSPLSARPPR